MQRNYITADYEDYQRVMVKPVEYMKLAMNDKENEGRDSALILTKEDILNIKRYEKHSLNLPITLKRVEEYLGFTSSDIPGLEPSDILILHKDINGHAHTWANIEGHIKLTGLTIDLFAAQFTTLGKTILDTVDKMDIVDQLTTTVGELSLEDIELLEQMPLNEKDRRIVTALSSILRNKAAEIALLQQGATELTGKLGTFSQTLAEQLVPAVNHKVILTSRSDLDQQVKDLETDIAQLTVEIDQKNKEYKQAMKNIAWGGFGGPIGVAITGGIFGSKAEKARKEKNRLVAQKEAKVRELNKKRPLAAAIRNLEILFEDMRIRMDDAQESSANLRDLWAILSAYVANSADILEQITDNKTLFEFFFEFQDVVRPWGNVKDITRDLLELFDNALEQFKREQDQQS